MPKKKKNKEESHAGILCKLSLLNLPSHSAMESIVMAWLINHFKSTNLKPNAENLTVGVKNIEKSQKVLITLESSWASCKSNETIF